MNIAIIAVAYNRIEGLKRLLNSLLHAEYKEDHPTLIISVDKSETLEVEDFAKEFHWPFGEKYVRTFSENQGLKKHILSCGEYFNQYDVLIILEDDIYVSPSYYQFAEQASKYYMNDKCIAGISLYKHLFNVDASRPFCPINKGADVYFMKYAQSWGQVWMKNQWIEFKNWYNNHSELFTEHENLPENVCGWSKSSWLKYHIRYCVENNKYFVYPYESQVTCFSDVGEHNVRKIRRFQVPILCNTKSEFVFVPFDYEDSRCVVYDQYFENQELCRILQVDCDIDLYGRRKNNNKRYLLSTKSLNYEIISSWALELRPHEANVIYNIKGNSIFLYDKNTEKKNTNKNSIVDMWHYDNRTEGLVKREISVLFEEVLCRISGKIHQLRNKVRRNVRHHET